MMIIVELSLTSFVSFVLGKAKPVENVPDEKEKLRLIELTVRRALHTMCCDHMFPLVDSFEAMQEVIESLRKSLTTEADRYPMLTSMMEEEMQLLNEWCQHAGAKMDEHIEAKSLEEMQQWLAKKRGARTLNSLMPLDDILPPEPQVEEPIITKEEVDRLLEL